MTSDVNIGLARALLYVIKSLYSILVLLLYLLCLRIIFKLAQYGLKPIFCHSKNDLLTAINAKMCFFE